MTMTRRSTRLRLEVLHGRLRYCQLQQTIKVVRRWKRDEEPWGGTFLRTLEGLGGWQSGRISYSSSHDNVCQERSLKQILLALKKKDMHPSIITERGDGERQLLALKKTIQVKPIERLESAPSHNTSSKPTTAP